MYNHHIYQFLDLHSNLPVHIVWFGDNCSTKNLLSWRWEFFKLQSGLFTKFLHHHKLKLCQLPETLVSVQDVCFLGLHGFAKFTHTLSCCTTDYNALYWKLYVLDEHKEASACKVEGKEQCSSCFFPNKNLISVACICVQPPFVNVVEHNLWNYSCKLFCNDCLFQLFKLKPILFHKKRSCLVRL